MGQGRSSENVYTVHIKLFKQLFICIFENHNDLCYVVIHTHAWS